MSTKTKERLTKAAALAKEVFGESALNENPNVVSAILVSMTMDDLGDTVKQENEKLTECIYKAAGHIAD